MSGTFLPIAGVEYVREPRITDIGALGMVKIEFNVISDFVLANLLGRDS